MYFKLSHATRLLSKQVKKGNAFHWTLMAPIWFRAAILPPTSECHLNISQRESGRGSNESWTFHWGTLPLAERRYWGRDAPSHMQPVLACDVELYLYVTWQGVSVPSLERTGDSEQESGETSQEPDTGSSPRADAGPRRATDAED